MSITVLTWPPDSRSWDLFMPSFTAYFLYQGLVQFLQARYQKSRHYARMAMGKAAHMDVSHTETISEYHSGLVTIVVLVFIAHLWQVLLGLRMFAALTTYLNVSQPWYEFKEEVQCVILGVLFIFLGVTNFYVTVSTLQEKWAKAKRAPPSLSPASSFSSDQTNGDGLSPAAPPPAAELSDAQPGDSQAASSIRKRP
jgi:TMPIT-like protein